MLPRSLYAIIILCAYVMCMAKGNPLHADETLLDVDESNEIETVVEQPTIFNVISNAIVKVLKNVDPEKSSVGEAREGKSSKNNIRDLLLDKSFESVDFSGAVFSPDGKKECVNKTQFVETVVSDR